MNKKTLPGNSEVRRFKEMMIWLRLTLTIKMVVIVVILIRIVKMTVTTMVKMNIKTTLKAMMTLAAYRKCRQIKKIQN